MATYVNDLRLKEIATGDEAGTWGTSTNTNLELIGEALGFGTEAITTNANTHTSTIADGSTDQARAMYIKYTGTLDSACTITIGPNTIKRVHIIENATSGSQTIIIKQGSGGTVTIPNGQISVVMLDGAGSGAAVLDAFTDLNMAGTITAATAFSSPLIVGSTSVQTPLIEFTDGDNAIAIADGGGITAAAGITSTAAANSFGATSFNDAAITNVGDIQLDSITGDGDTNTSITFSGSDTITVAAAGANQVTFKDGAFSPVTDSDVDLGTSSLYFKNAYIDTVTTTGAMSVGGEIAATSLDISGDIDVDGTTNLDIVDIDGAVDMASTLGVTGVVTANAGVVVDEMTIDGDTLTATDEFIIDAASHIKLDTDSGNLIFLDAGSTFSKIINSSGDVFFSAEPQDKDIKFNGNDGGAAITALSLDMSDAGTAIFNHDIQIADSGLLRMGAGGDLIAFSDGTNALINANNGNLTLDVAGDIILDADGGDLVFKDGGTDIYKINTSSSNVSLEAQVSDANIIFKGNDGGSEITALTLDISEGGTALFNGDVVIGHTAAVGTVHKGDLQVKSAISILDGSNTTAATFGLWSSGANAAFISVDPDQEGDNSVLHFIMDAGIKMTLDSIGRLNIDQVESRLGTGALNITGEVGQSNNAIQFRHNASTVVGTVVTSASATAYNTSSDYRLKENVDYTWDATTRLKQLKPARFNFITDADTLVDGFLAHEVSSIVPEAITGAKDAVDADGNPDYQGIDQSKLVPLLVKTIQELEARITALES